MNRHEFFKKRLKELGMYDKDSDYDGLIGKWIEELSTTFANQGHSGQSAVITTQLFNKIMLEYGGEGFLPPIPPAPAGGIVEATEKVAEYFSAEWGKRFRVFAQAIEAEIEEQGRIQDDQIIKLDQKIDRWRKNLEAEIEAVRKLFRNHEGRIAKLEHYSPESFERVNVLTKDMEAQRIRLAGVQRKVESLGEEYRNHLIEHHNVRVTVKPQPVAEGPERSRGGQAPDKDGKMHDLIPGRSVIETPNVEMLFLYTNKYGNFVGYTSSHKHRGAGGRWIAIPGDCTWLRDFDFPGGDK